MSDAGKFLSHVLAPLREDERWRLEYIDMETRESAGRHRMWLDLEKMADQAVRHGQEQNVYFAVSTFAAKGPEGEPGRRSVPFARRIAALWADVDVGPGKPYATRQAALERLRAFNPAPTALVHSGRGVHAWWRLSEPVEGDDLHRAVRLVRGLALALDGDPNVADAARIMRIPGTLNTDPKGLKDGKTYAVELIELSDAGPYQTLDDFAVAGVAEIAAKTERRRDESGGALPETEAAEFQGGRVHDAASLKLGGIMRNLLAEPGEGGYGDNSKADAALLLALLAPRQGGLSAADAYATFFASPRGQDAIARKPDPDYYVRHTIENALAHLAATRPPEQVRRELVAKAELEPGDKQALLAEVSAVLGFRVIRVERIIMDPPEFRLVTDLGAIMLGTWQNAMTTSKFSGYCEPVTLRTVPAMKPAEWAEVRELMLRCVEDVAPSDELTATGQMRAWLAQYIEDNPLDAGDEAAQSQVAALGQPFLNAERRVCIRIPHFLRFIRLELGERPEPKRVHTALHQVGWRNTKANLTGADGKRNEYRCWVGPEGWAGE